MAETGAGADLKSTLDQIRAHPAAPLLVVILFCVLGLTGAPQFALILAVTVTFGPILGSLYAWGATLISALLGYTIGAVFGTRMLNRWGNESVLRVSQALGRRGILSSALIRLVPSGPFIVVNVLAGASHVRAQDFALGTALGIIPKIMLIALISSGAVGFLNEGDPGSIALILGGIALWVILGVVVRERMRSANGQSQQA